MTARERLDAVEASSAHMLQVFAHGPSGSSYYWDDTLVLAVQDDVPALVAALRAVLAVCDRYERADSERHDRVSAETVAAKVVNAIDTHLGGAP